MGFATDLKALCDAAKEHAGTVVRKVALDLGSQMIDRSPVDTGRFKSNWMTEIGVNTGATTTAADKSGSASKAMLASAIAGWEPGKAIWITNNLPYAYRLEYKGWSKQAPGGMVRLAVQDTQRAVAKAAKEVRG